MNEKVNKGMSEVRLDGEDQVDDVVIQCDAVHFECMDEHCFWMGIYRGDDRITFNFMVRDDGELIVEMDENGLDVPVVGSNE